MSDPPRRIVVPRREFIRRLLALSGSAAAASALPALAAVPENGRPLSIVIVGAGLAGLVAAYELEKRGHRVPLRKFVQSNSRHCSSCSKPRDFRRKRSSFSPSPAVRKRCSCPPRRRRFAKRSTKSGRRASTRSSAAPTCSLRRSPRAFDRSPGFRAWSPRLRRTRRRDASRRSIGRAARRSASRAITCCARFRFRCSRASSSNPICRDRNGARYASSTTTRRPRFLRCRGAGSGKRTTASTAAARSPIFRPARPGIRPTTRRRRTRGSPRIRALCSRRIHGDRRRDGSRRFPPASAKPPRFAISRACIRRSPMPAWCARRAAGAGTITRSRAARSRGSTRASTASSIAPRSRRKAGSISPASMRR